VRSLLVVDLADGAGLNINHGQQILIRLRYPSNRRSFLPLEQALDTMLHEYVNVPA
jgi:hypothetical protein